MERGSLDSNSDFNSIPLTGYYSMERCGDSPNGPGIMWGVLINIKTIGGYKVQIATNNNTVIRIRLGDNYFREWKTISLT